VRWSNFWKDWLPEVEVISFNGQTVPFNIYKHNHAQATIPKLTLQDVMNLELPIISDNFINQNKKSIVKSIMVCTFKIKLKMILFYFILFEIWNNYIIWFYFEIWNNYIIWFYFEIWNNYIIWFYFEIWNNYIIWFYKKYKGNTVKDLIYIILFLIYICYIYVYIQFI